MLLHRTTTLHRYLSTVLYAPSLLTNPKVCKAWCPKASGKRVCVCVAHLKAGLNPRVCWISKGELLLACIMHRGHGVSCVPGQATLGRANTDISNAAARWSHASKGCRRLSCFVVPQIQIPRRQQVQGSTAVAYKGIQLLSCHAPVAFNVMPYLHPCMQYGTCKLIPPTKRILERIPRVRAIPVLHIGST